ncbi:MAG: hypothetical protein KGH75_00185 [Rhodospirillales bacterium]|nr:hypothetical protein [Rhodospirillales bacterium]
MTAPLEEFVTAVEQRLRQRNERDPGRTIEVEVGPDGERVATVTQANGRQFRVHSSSPEPWRLAGDHSPGEAWIEYLDPAE